MKIYDKKLLNLKELRRERQLLKNRINQDNDSKSKDREEGEKESFVSGLLSGVTSGSLLTSAINIAPTVIDMVRKRSFKKSHVPHSLNARKPKKNIVIAAATDFITGYIKWKLLELSYKGIKKALKSDASKKLRRNASSKFRKVFK